MFAIFMLAYADEELAAWEAEEQPAITHEARDEALGAVYDEHER